MEPRLKLIFYKIFLQYEKVPIRPTGAYPPSVTKGAGRNQLNINESQALITQAK